MAKKKRKKLLKHYQEYIDIGGFIVVKKFVILGITFLMLFSLAACNDDFNLSSYKTAAKAEIAGYVTESNYCPDNWSIACDIIDEGKIAIDVAEDKTGVDTAVSIAKDLINMVSRKLRGEPESNGELAPPIWTAFTSDKSRLKIGEDLTIKLYYGTSKNFPNEDDDVMPIDTFTKIIMGYSVYGNLDSYGGGYSSELIEEIVLKEIDDFGSQNYPAAGLNSISETITVPANWFVGEKGCIGWSIGMYAIWSKGSEPKNYGGGGIALYYRIEDENIILFDSYYKFFNDIRN